MATLTITAVNPLDHADEIKGLFMAHERPEFPEYFDRSFPAAVQAGAMSWLGRDGAGQVVMHIGCFPQRFRFGGREVVGGLFVNLMVAQPYRSFFPALALIKRAKQDIGNRRDIDFIYADPNEQAKAVMEACGFPHVGTLGRYVLLLGDRHWIADRAIGLVHAASRVVRRGALVAACPARDIPTGAFDVPMGDSSRLRPYHGSARYAARLAGYPTPLDWWFTLPRNGDTGAFAAGLLVRGPDGSGVASLHSVRRDPEVPLGRLLPRMTASLRARGCTRLQVTTMVDSLFAGEVRREGFVLREHAVPIVATALTPAGEAVLRSPQLWEITNLDCDR